MNYAAIYKNLIKRARGRVIDGYTERHHVKPRCLGGSDHKRNIVRLTAAEHYVAHQLLVKINPGHRGLIWAAIAMTEGGRTNGRVGNKLYVWLKAAFIARQTGSSRWSPEVKARIGAAAKARNQGKNHPRYGCVVTVETRAKQSASMKGRPSPRKGVKLSEETKAKLRMRCKAAHARGCYVHGPDGRIVQSGDVTRPVAPKNLRLAANGGIAV